MIHPVPVVLPEGRDYHIHIGERALAQLGVVCAGIARSSRVVVITQPAIQKHWGSLVEEAFSTAGFQRETICYPAGERHKNLTMVERLYRELYQLSPAIDRKTLLVALGGGVVGDMVGFVAASYLRGLDYVQVPTTLLAMVDSSVGGKTGVDFLAGKNLIGSFHQPRAVVIDPSVLMTLPRREVRAGLAEVVKYGVIQEPDLLTYLQDHVDTLFHRDPAALAHVVLRSCTIKAAVVTADEREETGLRAILNFGHTIGHALESATNYRRYKHGEAVAIGMISAAFIGQAACVTPPELTQTLCEVLRALKLPLHLPDDIDDNLLVTLTGRDKKAEEGVARFVLASQLGQVALQTIDTRLVYAGLCAHRHWGKAG